MRGRFSLMVVVVACATSVAGATEFSYLGSRADSALLETPDHRVEELRRGQSIEELGEVTDITEDEVVFERALDARERAELEAAGAAIPDLRRLRLRRGLDVSRDGGSLIVPSR